MIKRVHLHGKEYILLGTAHVSAASVAEVEAVIAGEAPDVVAVELCQDRYDNLNNENRFDEVDLAAILKKGQVYSVLANFLLAAYQKKMGEALGVRPGAEMVAAVEKARETEAAVALVDRDISITLKRVTRNLRWRDKLSGAAAILEALFSKEEGEGSGEEAIEALKDDSVILDTLNEMGLQFPNVKHYLLDERDEYMAYRLSRLEGQKILAVVGAGHLHGIQRHLENGDVDKERFRSLKAIPAKSPWPRIAAFAFAAFLLISLGFTLVRNPLQGVQSLGTWLLFTAGLGGLGTFIAGGHPLAVLAAMVGSPLGAASPFLSSGMIGALAEARLRKPLVRDFHNLSDDAPKLRMWRRNRLLRVFLIFYLGSLGSAIGNILGVKFILDGILQVL